MDTGTGMKLYYSVTRQTLRDEIARSSSRDKLLLGNNPYFARFFIAGNNRYDYGDQRV